MATDQPRDAGLRALTWDYELDDADAVGETAHERLAARELVHADPLVRLVGLRDAAGAADDRGQTVSGLDQVAGCLCGGGNDHFAATQFAFYHIHLVTLF